MSKPAEDRSAEKYEKSDVPSVMVAAVGVVLVMFTWVLLDASATLFRHLRRSDQASVGTESSVLAQRALPPEPRLQEDPKHELESYLVKEKELLGSYGWVDRPAGIARIPISRAMEILSHERP